MARLYGVVETAGHCGMRQNLFWHYKITRENMPRPSVTIGRRWFYTESDLSRLNAFFKTLEPIRRQRQPQK